MADENLSGPLLREETLALRDLFGLTLKNPIFTVDSSSTLIQSTIKDVLFLAIDIEGLICQTALPLQFQLGISILDTRYLQTLISSNLYNEQKIDERETELQNILQTYNFCYGPLKYYLKAQKKFLFGETQEMVIEEINTKIQNLISGRDVILVVHGGGNDLRFLKRLKISIQPIYTLDTQKAAQYPLQLLSRPSLKSFLTAFEIPFISQALHIAGNDANYTLRSLLMIAVKDTEMEEGLNDRQHALLKVLQGLARSPLPGNGNQNCHTTEGKGRQGRLETRKRKKERKAARKLARKNGQEKELDKE